MPEGNVPDLGLLHRVAHGDVVRPAGGVVSRFNDARLKSAGIRFMTKLLGGACAGVSLRGSA